MDSTKFRCPHCNRSLSAKKRVRGQVVCPACKGKIEIPEFGATPLTIDDRPCNTGLIKLIRTKARAALFIGIVGLLCVAAAALAPRFFAGRTDRSLSPIGRAFQNQSENHKREAAALGSALVGIALGIFANRRARSVLKLIQEQGVGFGERGRVNAGMYVGWIAIAANAAMALFAMTGGFAAG